MLTILVAVLMLCLILWIVHMFLPIDSRIKTVIMLIILIVFVLYLFQGRGTLGSLA